MVAAIGEGRPGGGDFELNLRTTLTRREYQKNNKSFFFGIVLYDAWDHQMLGQELHVPRLMKGLGTYGKTRVVG